MFRRARRREGEVQGHRRRPRHRLRRAHPQGISHVHSQGISPTSGPVGHSIYPRDSHNIVLSIILYSWFTNHSFMAYLFQVI